MGAVQAVGQVAAHSQKTAGVKATNRQRLKQFESDNRSYQKKVQLDNANYFNSVIEAEVEQEGIFEAMVEQWDQLDHQLDQLFANSSFKVQDAMIEMYENEYAGTQTGATAARRAGSSARKKGYAVAKELSTRLLAKEEVALKKQGSKLTAFDKIDAVFDKVKFPPRHGHTPVPPVLQAKPSTASLMLNLAGTALSTYVGAKAMGTTDTGMKNINTLGDGGIDIDAVAAYSNPVSQSDIYSYADRLRSTN